LTSPFIGLGDKAGVISSNPVSGAIAPSEALMSLSTKDETEEGRRSELPFGLRGAGRLRRRYDHR
jgi:hypothetical protein